MAEHTYQSLEQLPVRQVILVCLDMQRRINELTGKLARLEDDAGQQPIRTRNACPHCGYTHIWEMPRRRQCKRCKAVWAREE
ncbi:MAG: hypothetical protein WAU16_00555 [Rhizobiaceae bacterium]